MRHVFATVFVMLTFAASAVAKTKVAVFDFVNATPKGERASLGVALPQLLGSKLGEVAGIEIVDMNKPGKMPATAPGDADAIGKTATGVGAGIGIGGRVYYSKKEFRLVAVIVDARAKVAGGQFLPMAECKVAGPPEKMMSLLSDLAVVILEKLGTTPTKAELALIRRDSTRNPAALDCAAAGIRFQRAGEHDKALASYDKALKADPKFAEMHTTAASMLLYVGKPEEAARRAQAAVAIVPNDPPIRIACALTLLAANRPDEAIEHADEAERLWPNNSEIRLWTAHMLSVKGDHEAALAKCKPVLAAPGLDPESLLIPFAMRTSMTPGPGVFCVHLSSDMFEGVLGTSIASNPTERMLIRSFLMDQIAFIVSSDSVSPKDADALWLHNRANRARLVVDGATYRPNLIGRLLAAFKEDSSGVEQDGFAMLCFDGSANGVPLVTDDTKAMTLVFDELAGARRELTWIRPAQADRCFQQLAAPLLAKTPVDGPGGNMETMLFSAFRVDGHGDAPLAAFWLSPAFVQEVETMFGQMGGGPEAQMAAETLKTLHENVLFILLSPTQGEFMALPLDDAAATATAAIDGGQPIAAHKVTLLFADEMVDGMSDHGRHTAKLLAFLNLGEDGLPILDKGSKKLTLTIKGFAGAPERVLVWTLPLEASDSSPEPVGE